VFTKIRIFGLFFSDKLQSYPLSFLHLTFWAGISGKCSVERSDLAVLASAIILVLVVTDFEVPYEYPDGKIIDSKICSPLKASSLNRSEAISPHSQLAVLSCRA